MSRHSLKKARNSTLPPLPGQAGQRFFELFNKNEHAAATAHFRDAFIGDDYFPVPIRILEDDGYTLVFESDRGLFKVCDFGRLMVLEVREVECKRLEDLAPAKQLAIEVWRRSWTHRSGRSLSRPWIS